MVSRSILSSVAALLLAAFSIAEAEVTLGVGQAAGQPGETVEVELFYLGNGVARAYDFDVTVNLDKIEGGSSGIDVSRCLENSPIAFLSDCVVRPHPNDGTVRLGQADLTNPIPDLDPIGVIRYTVSEAATPGEIIELQITSFSVEGLSADDIEVVEGQILVLGEPEISLGVGSASGVPGETVEVELFYLGNGAARSYSFDILVDLDQIEGGSDGIDVSRCIENAPITQIANCVVRNPPNNSTVRLGQVDFFDPIPDIVPIGVVQYTISSSATAGDIISLQVTNPIVENVGPAFIDIVSGQIEVVFQEASITFADLEQVYTGGPLAPSLTTEPEGLAVELTFDGSSDLPVDAGSYAVEATVTSPGFSGIAEALFIISPAEAQIELDELVQTYTGSQLMPTIETSPVGLNVIVSYDGQPDAPINAGEYLVEATVDDPNFLGQASRTFVIEPAEAQIELDDLVQTYTGSPLMPTVETLPAGLNVLFSFDGQPDAPINAGDYLLEVAVDDPNFLGQSSASFVIEPVVAEILFDDLIQDFTGEPLEPTITTLPEGLAFTVTYNGKPGAPVTSGAYLVEVVINEPNFTGEASAQFVIFGDEVFQDRFQSCHSGTENALRPEACL